MNALALLSQLAPSLFGLVDKFVPDNDAAAKIKAEITTQMLDSTSELAKAGASVVTAEVQGESWLQRNWRPMLMIWFSILIGGYWFGFVPVNMPIEVVESVMNLVTIGMSGYVIGRTGEKIAKTMKG